VKLSLLNTPRREHGFALMLTLFFGAVSLMALGGALLWTSSTARISERNNKYFAATSAAEAATEKVLTSISRDYLLGGESTVYHNLDKYRAFVPSAGEFAGWSGYSFSDGQKNTDKTYVERTSAATFVPLDSQYKGLYGLAAGYRIISNARAESGGPPLIAAVRQDIQVAAIPIFQFAIFYTMDLEINPGPVMTVNGRVHSNRDIYLQPQLTLTFLDHVTAAGKINMSKSSLDPTARTKGTVDFQGEHDAGVRTLNLPIGTTNTPAAVREIVEIPPASELTNSALGQQRFYNKADIVVLVTNNAVTIKSGGGAINIPFNQVSNWVSTNVSFTNKREGKTVQATQIDVSKLITWSATNTLLRPLLGRDVNSIYVADNRTQLPLTEPGIRLVNGATLPSRGLTVATPDPLYVLGDFNAPAADLGTTNTLRTKPAALIADAVTMLSANWKDANSSSSIANRIAVNTTVNAAIVSGLTESNGFNYSGGVENLPRFLEDWTGKTLTYNGSMVAMFLSKYAVAPWGGASIYVPPNRNWTFDLNFLDATKLPPMTPMLLTTIRNSWAMIPPDTIK
jgi:hypothetical protein